MKNLFLLLGAPAIGKSTFIKKNALEEYTIEIDKLRDLFGSTKRVLSDDNNQTISVQTHDADQQVWDLAFDITEDRMSKGKTTIIDATFLFPSAFNKPFALAKKYNYKVVIIDFMADAVKKFNASYNHHEALLEHLIQNDRKRNQNIPEYVFERYITRYFDTLSANNGTKITPSVFEKQYLSPLEPIDLNAFNRIKVIGDVHGDHSALMKVFDDHKRGDAYVFVGDYLDRGTKNVETFKFLSKLKGKNLFFLKGNHENHILHFVENGKVTGRDFKTITLPELLRNGVSKTDLKNFSRQLRDYLYFTFDNQTFMVSHAGIEPSRLHEFEVSNDAATNINFADETEFVDGLSKPGSTPYENDVDTSFTDAGMATIQIHGHRNAFGHPAQVSNNSYNLTGPIGNDTFRYLVIEKD